MSLWRVVISSQSKIIYSNHPREILWKYVFKTKGSLVNTVKQEFYCNIKKYNEIRPKLQKKLTSSIHLGLGGLGVFSTCLFKCLSKQAKCEAINLEYDINDLHDKQLSSFKWITLLKYLLPHICYLLVAITSAFVVAILNIWIPQSVGHVVNVITKVRQGTNNYDNNFYTSIFQQLAAPAFRLARMYLIQAFFTFTYIYTLSCVGERVAMQLRQDLFKSVIMQDIEFFDKHRSGEIMNRLTTDIQDFKSSFKMIISRGFRSLTQIVGCVISVIIISPQLTGVMILCLPTVIFIGTLIGRNLRNLSNEAQSQIAKSTAVCEEAIQNIRTVRAFAAEEKELESFSNEVESAATLYERLGLGIGLFQAGTNIFLNSILLSTLYFGGHLISSGQLSPGDLMAFLMATQTIQRSLTQISELFGTYVKGASAGVRIFEYLELKPSPIMTGGLNIGDEFVESNIKFENVTFSYPTRPDAIILKNFNLDIPAGKTVGIVGASGQGKSTIAALLERMYEVSSGSISIGGIDIKTLNSSDLRRKVLGYIGQEPVLFSTSIMNNIRYGNDKASDDDVIEVAKEANAHEFIESFPEGYYTQVGERGAQLSGGQKQRVAIARALIKKPSILILDEATSALDYDSERIVQKALDHAMKDRTVLVIAHRLSTIKDADIIVVLKHGAIVEMGTHTELIQKQGVYYNLVKQEKDNENEM
ncbi:mitochondrial potassium channel ATP-binding subunit [Chelonus insularis]|uniref:mitochondrial potassium channel ATP-binding subunit n=1 Tax=Chelonus insularis TaxID=460826 RepID=UPI00158A626C|nr:mitochondrial potassium channel ATP-binding subunit [Chelonus insularis]XP_034952516.1 mitochondrial potassium channel ATP-binding subunit [Chelonus insularis]XP_034952517.1 mitochondrial potassium channel ATP-binding subunit [Chelonus insularis]